MTFGVTFNTGKKRHENNEVIHFIELCAGLDNTTRTFLRADFPSKRERPVIKFLGAVEYSFDEETRVYFNEYQIKNESMMSIHGSTASRHGKYQYRDMVMDQLVMDLAITHGPIVAQHQQFRGENYGGLQFYVLTGLDKLANAGDISEDKLVEKINGCWGIFPAANHITLI